MAEKSSMQLFLLENKAILLVEIVVELVYSRWHGFNICLGMGQQRRRQLEIRILYTHHMGTKKYRVALDSRLKSRDA